MIVLIIRLTSLLLLQKQLPSVSEQTTGTMMGKEERKRKTMPLTQGAFKLFQKSLRKGQSCLWIREPHALTDSNKPVNNNSTEPPVYEFIQFLSSLSLKSFSRHYLTLPKAPVETRCKYYTHPIDIKVKSQRH